MDLSSALSVAAAIRAKEVSPVEVLDACLARVDEVNDRVNAVVWRDDEQARVRAKAAADAVVGGDDLGPFHGVPIPIKDLTPVEGWPATYGSHGAPAGVAPESELVVTALERAGFLLAGRTNTPEFGPITVTENLRYGPTRNPVEPRPHAGRLQRRYGCLGRVRDVPRRARQRRRRLDPHPVVVLRPGGSQAQPRAGPGDRDRLGGSSGGRRADTDGR